MINPGPSISRQDNTFEVIYDPSDSQLSANSQILHIGGFSISANCAADGVTNDTAVIAAAIARLPAAGGTVLLPAGSILCANLALPSFVTLQGVASGGISSPTGGTLLQQIGTNPIITMIGADEFNRVYYPTLYDLTLNGSGGAGKLVDAKYASYIRFTRVSWNNTTSSWVRLWDCYDSRMLDNEFTFGGSLDGTVPGIDLHSEGGANATNEIYITDSRFESFLGTAIAATGSNTFSVTISNAKFESNISTKQFIKLASAVDVNISKAIFTSAVSTSGGTVPIALPAFIDLNTCQDIAIDATFTINDSFVTIDSYVKSVASSLVDVTARLLISCPAPSGGYIVDWDGAFADSFSAAALSYLSTPVYNYFFGAQKSPIDSSGTSVFTGSGGTVSILKYQSAIVVNSSGAMATLTIALPTDAKNGQQVSYYFANSVAALTVTGGAAVNGAPASVVAGGFFTMRYIVPAAGWFRIG